MNIERDFRDAPTKVFKEASGDETPSKTIEQRPTRPGTFIYHYLRENRPSELPNLELESVSSLFSFLRKSIVERYPKVAGRRIKSSRWDLGLHLSVDIREFIDIFHEEVFCFSGGKIILYESSRKRAILVEKDQYPDARKEAIYRIKVFDGIQDRKLLSNPLKSADPLNPDIESGHVVNYHLSQNPWDGIVEVGLFQFNTVLIVLPDNRWAFFADDNEDINVGFFEADVSGKNIKIFCDGEPFVTIPRKPNLPEITELFERFFEERPKPPSDS